MRLAGELKGRDRHGAPLRALRRRRKLRAGLTQLLFVVAAVALGLTAPRISTGPTVNADEVKALLFALAAAVIPFVSIVFSLLFLVVQFGSTTLTPRLNLFRDDPLVWRAFGYFMGVFVGCAVAGLAIGSDDTVSVVVPVAAIVAILASLVVFRALQFAAFRSIQLAPTLLEITERGRAVIDALYVETHDELAEQETNIPPVGTELRWPNRSAVLQQIDLPGLVAIAERCEGVVQLTIAVGDVLREDGVVAKMSVKESRGADDAIVQSFEAGLERTFDQDPRFAFRLLADIALRALSAAVNDEATAVQVIDAIDSLLARLATRRLNVGQIAGADGALRVVLVLPSWNDYLGLALDEITASAVAVPSVRARIDRLLSDLAVGAPPARRPMLEQRRRSLTDFGAN
jgi:uncharacterized membrane protein